MLEKSDKRRVLMHRLNGQMLKALDRRLDSLLGTADWKLDDWIINILLLNRSLGRTYVARLETSSTFYRGHLFQDPSQLDPDKVGGLDLEVPMNISFSGYCIQTSDIVWIDDLPELSMDPSHPLHSFYRRFEHVAVRPVNEPKAEYLFPILVQVGLNHTVLGVLNMEYFGGGSPFKRVGQLKASAVIMRLLYAHGPFLLIAGLEKVASLVSSEVVAGVDTEAGDLEKAEASTGKPEASAGFESDLLRVHRQVLDAHVGQGNEKEAEE